MSVLKQYVQLSIKLNDRTLAILFFEDPNSYVKFFGAELLITDIGLVAVRQVGVYVVSVQGS